MISNNQFVMSDKVLGVLGGDDLPPQVLARWAESADWIIAADSGIHRLSSAGFLPNLVIGDFDSSSNELRSQSPQSIYDANPDATDCDKLLKESYTRGYRSITLACIEGDQLDHMLATLSSAIAIPLEVQFALRQGVGRLIRPGEEVEFISFVGQRLSLIPLLSCEGVDLQGVEWGLENESIRPGGKLSISNRSSSDRVRVNIGSGAALLVVEVPLENLPWWGLRPLE